MTTRQDLPATVIAERMFARWRQENFFKYMQAEFNLDHLSTSATEPADPQRCVPHPERARFEKALKAKKTQLGRANVRQAMPSRDGASPAKQAQEAPTIDRLARESDALGERIQALDKRVPLTSVLEEDQIVQHETERRTITQLIKVVANRSEICLASLVEPFFARHDAKRDQPAARQRSRSSPRAGCAPQWWPSWASRRGGGDTGRTRGGCGCAWVLPKAARPG